MYQKSIFIFFLPFFLYFSLVFIIHCCSLFYLYTCTVLYKMSFILNDSIDPNTWLTICVPMQFPFSPLEGSPGYSSPTGGCALSGGVVADWGEALPLPSCRLPWPIRLWSSYSEQLLTCSARACFSRMRSLSVGLARQFRVTGLFAVRIVTT